MTHRAICSSILLMGLSLCAGCAAQIGPITGKKYSGYTMYQTTTLMAYSDREAMAYLREVRLAEYLKAHPDTKPELKQTMLEGQLQIGMTPEQVKVVSELCDSVSNVTSSWGTSEQWRCPGWFGQGDRYLYFDNGKLTTVQTSR